MRATQQLDELFRGLGKVYSNREILDVPCEVVEEERATEQVAEGDTVASAMQEGESAPMPEEDAVPMQESETAAIPEGDTSSMKKPAFGADAERESALAPSLRMEMNDDPDEIISHEILLAAARRIREEARGGFFNREFTEENGDQAIEFDINCRLIYSPDESRVTGVIFYRAFATSYDRDGRELTTDFTEEELRGYLIG